MNTYEGGCDAAGSHLAVFVSLQDWQFIFLKLDTAQIIIKKVQKNIIVSQTVWDVRRDGFAMT